MPLSEHEERQLNEMERVFLAESPRLARKFTAPLKTGRTTAHAVAVGLAFVLAGAAAGVLASAFYASREHLLIRTAPWSLTATCTMVGAGVGFVSWVVWRLLHRSARSPRGE